MISELLSQLGGLAGATLHYSTTKYQEKNVDLRALAEFLEEVAHYSYLGFPGPKG